MIEQAGDDRALFNGSTGSPTVVLKFPEIFNTGSPFNVPAGQGGGDLDELVAHYQKQNVEREAEKRKSLMEGKTTSIYD